MKIQRKIRQLAKAMDENGIEQIEVDDRYFFGLVSKKLQLTKKGQRAFAVQGASYAGEAPAVNAAIAAAAPRANGTLVNSPMVGVVYFAAEPGAKKFIEVGKSVKAGDTLCLIEAMKTFSPVKAERDGVIAEIIAKDGQVVEFDTPILVIA
jgi:acetyl-CoA carboxylase biotin carboxyl carrier protein